MLKSNCFFSLKIKPFLYSSTNLSSLKKTNFYLKDEFFSYNLNCKSTAKKFSTSSFLNLPLLNEQSEKSLIFFHDDLWEEEDKFRSRYCLRIIFALKKYQENNPRPTVSNSLLDSNIVCKNIKIILSYLKNSLVTDLDRINSKFLLFFYFLTKTNYSFTKRNKQKLVLRNLFFLFIFFLFRREYFLSLSNANSLISKNYILYKPRIRYVTSVFPQGLFLLIYSPYKSSFNFSSTNLFLSRQLVFTKRLNYVKSLIYNNKAVQINTNFLFLPKLLKIPSSQSLSNKNFGLLFNRLKFSESNKISVKIHNFKPVLNKFVSKKLHGFFSKKLLKKYNKDINISLEQNSTKKFFLISSSFNSVNYSILLKFLRKFIWRQLNKFKLRIYKLTFYFYRRFPRGVVLHISKLLAKFRFFFSEFAGWLNLSSRALFLNSFNRLGFNLFFQKTFINLLKMEETISFVDFFRTKYISDVKKKTFLYSQNDYSNFNIGSILYDKLKINVIQNSFISISKPINVKIKLKKNFNLLLKLNLISDFYFYLKTVSSKKLQYEIFQTNVVFFIESFKFLNNFRFTLKFLMFSKFFLVTKFINVFSTFVSLLYIIFNSMRPDLISYNFQLFPLYYYINAANFSVSSFIFSSNLSIFNFFDLLSNKYKNFFTNFFIKKTKLNDYDAIRTKSMKKRLMNLKFLRQNSVQKFILDRQNLRNLEFLSDYVKRFVKKLKDAPKHNRSFSFLKYSGSKKKLKKKYLNNLLYSNSNRGFLNSKYKHSKYLLYKLQQRRNRNRIKIYKQQIFSLKSHIIHNEYFFDSYFYRFHFKKYITRLDFKRQRKRFYINVLFFNKFIKEKRVSVMYHRFLKGAHKITVFHKFSNPFFLRMKLKRYFVFDKIRRTLNRFSFLTSSSHFKVFMNNLVYISFLNIKNLKKNLHSSISVSKFFNLDKFSLLNFYYTTDNTRNKDELIIFNWLSNFKIKYFNLIVFPIFFSKFNNKNLLHFLFILKFLFSRGFLVFKKSFFDFLNEFFYFSIFFESIKIFYINFILFKSNFPSSKKNFSNRSIFLNLKSIRSYSTIPLYDLKNYGSSLIHPRLLNKKVFKLKYFFFNSLNKRVFNQRKYFDSLQIPSFIFVDGSFNFLTFLNFFYLSFFKISTFGLYNRNNFYFLKFFKNFNQLSLFVRKYSFSFLHEKYLFQLKYILTNKIVPFYSSKLFSSFTKNFGVGFFTFFYSSFRNFYSSFSRSVYSFILTRRLKFKKVKLKRKNSKNHRKNYYSKYTHPDSVYYLSNRKNVYKGFRFFKPNYPYNKFFSYYISYKLRPKEIRKKMFKNILFFKLPQKKKTIKSQKMSISILKHKNKKKLKNLRTKAEQQAAFRVHLYKKSLFIFTKNSFIRKKRIQDKFFKLMPKFSEKKKRTILSIPFSSIVFTNSIFQSTIFVGNLLKQKINSTFKKFGINPFKKLFNLNKYFVTSHLLINKSNLFFNTFKISKNLFLKFYTGNLLNLHIVFVNIKIQRFFRLLIYICNQLSSFYKFLKFSDSTLSLCKKDFFIFYNSLFSISYYDLFFYSDYYVFTQQTDSALPCFFFYSFNNFQKMFSNVFFFDLISSFFLESSHFDNDHNSFLSILSISFTFLANINSIFNKFDSFFVDFSFNKESELKLIQNSSVDFSYDFTLSNNFIFQFITFYTYFSNFQKLTFISNNIVPLKFLLSNFDFSFLQFLESFYFIRYIKRNNLVFLVLNNSFFQFLSNSIFIFIRRFMNLTNFNIETFNFILRIFFSLFDYNNFLFRNFVYNLVEKFIKSSNLKIKTKYSFLKSFLLLKNFNISNFSTIKYLKKKYYMYFKYYGRFKTSAKSKNFRIKTHKKSIQSLVVDPYKVTSNDVNIGDGDYNNFFNLLNFSGIKNLKFFHSRKLHKFSLSSRWFRDSFRKQMRLQRTFDIKPLHYRFIRRLRRRSKKFFLQKFYNHFLDSKIRINELFLTFFLIKKVRSINVFSTSKNSVKKFDSSSRSFISNSKFNFSDRNRLEPFFKRLLKRLRFNRVKLNRRHLLMKSKFHPMIRHKIFLGFFLSPKFFNFKNVSNFALFFQHYTSSKLKEKLFLFIRLNRFLEFIIKLIIKVKLFIRKNIYSLSSREKFSVLNKIFSLKSFSSILKIYRKVKLLLKHFFIKLVSQVRKKRGFDDNYIINLNLNSNLSTLKFMFFYNFLNLKFFKSFILRYFFFGDYLKSRFQFINRYLWFRTIPLNIFLLTPKIYIIITRARNNFFLTAIDLYGRILYKSSPGMVKFTGSDRMSKYAWFEASVDFFDGFIEFFRYFLKSRKKKKTSYSAIRIDREYSMRFNRIKKKFNAFMNPVIYHLAERRKLKKKAKKRRGKLKIRLRRFFIISKGISDFNLRIFLKGMVNERFYVSKYFAGAVNYPMRSFSLCRIKKVRRV